LLQSAGVSRGSRFSVPIAFFQDFRQPVGQVSDLPMAAFSEGQPQIPMSPRKMPDRK